MIAIACFVQPQVQKSPAGNTANYKPSSNYNPFDRVKFPLPACGDTLPTSLNDYPVNFYPVFIEDSGSNLQSVKSQFCGDAYPLVRQNTGRNAIQVASFTNQQKAEDFKNFLIKNFGSGEVGEPKKYESPP